MAGGSRADLWSGEEHLPAAQAGAGHAREAPGDRRRSHGRRAVIGSLGTTEHCFYRVGESHCPSWGSSLGTSHVGHGEASPTAAGASGRELPLMLCGRIHRDGWRSCSHENEVANFWNSATSSVLQLWQREEPTGAGQRGKCCAILWRRCHASQFEHEWA